MSDRRRPKAHLRFVRSKAVPVNQGIHYDDTTSSDRVPTPNLTALADNNLGLSEAGPVFKPDEPLDRDLVAELYGEQWRNATLLAARVISGYTAAEYEMDSRYVNLLVLPGVDVGKAMEAYFAQEAQAHPSYAWGNPESWSEDFAFESIMLFDDDATHYVANVVHPERLAAHGIRVIDTRQADWLPAYHEFSREKYSFHPHCESGQLRLPDRPYAPLSHNEVIDELTRLGVDDPTEFSVLLWLGEIELRDNGTFAVSNESYDPDKNHIPPWAIENFLSR